MDIFHAITQEIENVISCHWLDEFRTSTRSTANSRAATPRTQSAAPAISRSLSSASNSSVTSDSPILSRTSSSSSDMSSNKLMETERGGESTQYESIHTVTKPHSKQSGQLGDATDHTEMADEASNVDAERGEKTAENVRYGQNISESGMGGMTTTTTGTANAEGGYGGTAAQSELQGSDQARPQQQYQAGKNVHDHNVGA